MIVIDDLTVSYEGQIALSHVNLTVEEGVCYALIGPSGSGKSSLIRVVAGLLPTFEGSVLMNGAPISPKIQKIGFMPQNYGLFPWKTVYENVVLGAKIRKQRLEEARVKELLERLGISAFQERYPAELSGGQQQRVALARVFLLAPDILLMDEPFSALDAITREDMQEVFLSLWRADMRTTMLVTHYVEEALYLGQKIVRIAGHPGEVAEVYDNPFFGKKELRDSKEFAHAGRALRARLAD